MPERRTAWTVGTGGIGNAVASRLADSHDVVGFDRAGCPEHLIGYRVDAADREAFAKAAGEAVERHGSPDVLVVTAGRVSYATVESSSEQEALDVLSDNLLPVINVLHTAYAMEPTRPRTAVIVTSNAAFVPRPAQPLYAAAKAAVAGLVRSLAVGWSATGFRVLGVAPGTVAVPRNADRIASRYPHAPLDPDRPGGRLLRPEELADYIVGLLPYADHLTGQVLTIDGGSTLGAA
jgi:NAD(P)-dependent dehydrogenase (short-subunit alcohol dehydrogenase family)